MKLKLNLQGRLHDCIAPECLSVIIETCTSLMQMEVSTPSNHLPSTHGHNFIPEHAVSKSQVSVPRGPPDHAPLIEPTIF